MLALWLIELVMVALIVAALVWAIQQVIARTKSRERSQRYTQEFMRYDEARRIMLQQTQLLVEKGMTYEEAALTALSESYWPESTGSEAPLGSSDNKQFRSGKLN